MFFVFDSALQGRALVVGLVGTLACWTDLRARKNAPLALLGYVGIGLLSAAVHRWSALSSSAGPVWLSLFTPASHLAVMTVFIYGTAHLLRTSSRLSWFVVLAAAAVGVLATQIAFDRASVGFDYVRGGPSLPSVPHWSGIHGTSLVLTIGLPLVAGVSLTNHSVSRLLAGALMATGLLVAAYLNGSRGGLVSMCLVATAMALFGAASRSRLKSRPWFLLGLVATPLTLAATMVWFLRAHFANGEELSGRTLIWDATARLALDHPWLGVGPGNYAAAIVDSGHAVEYSRDTEAYTTPTACSCRSRPRSELSARSAWCCS